jgi:putative FmdB family regulatory protein
MPIHEYKCIKCGEVVEILYSTGESGTGCINCPKCGEFAYKVISVTNFIGEKGKGEWGKK